MSEPRTLIPQRLRRDAVRAVRAHRGLAVGWLRELVATDSEAPRERAAQELLAQLAASVGLCPRLLDADPDGTLERDPRFVQTGTGYSGRPNCVVTLPGAAGAPLVCNAHVDTVAVGEGWTRDPFGEVVGDRLYGRGACDTKGSLVAALLAAAVLVELGETVHAPLEIHSVIDEEPGGNGTLAVVRQLDHPRPPRLTLTMEPTTLDLLTGHRGMAWYGLECRGRQAHGSMAGGLNAIERAADVVTRLRALNGCLGTWQSGPYDPPRLNVGTIHGGHEVYTTPGSCQIEVSVRYAPGEAGLVDSAVRQAVTDAVPAGGVEVLFHRDFDAAETPEDDPAVLTALGVLRAHRPGAGVGRLAGTCDMRHYRNVLGVPSLIFGPGDLAVAHGPGEYVDVEEVLLAATVLVELALTPWGAQPGAVAGSEGAAPARPGVVPTGEVR